MGGHAEEDLCRGFCPAGLYYDVVYILSVQVHPEQAATRSLHSLAEQKQS